MKLVILPGQTVERAETHCSSGTTAEKLRELFATQGAQTDEARLTSKGGGWRAAFNITRFRTFIWTPGRQGYEIGGWTPGTGSDVIAKETIRLDCGVGLQGCQEVTELTLRLADEPDAGASLPK